MIGIPASAIASWGAWVVFLNVLLTRLGLPVPAVPILLLAGTGIAHGALAFWPTLCAAVVGALIGDGIWFGAGRIYGRKLLGTLSRLSPAVDTRVHQARALFERFGVPLVAVSKFVPGLGLITPPLMGTTPVDVRIYVLWDFLSVVIWAVFWLLGGAAAEHQLQMLIAYVRAQGATVIDVIILITLAFTAYRYWQRHRLQKKQSPDFSASANGTTIPTSTLKTRHATPLVFDARPASQRSDESEAIPGALMLDLSAQGNVDEVLVARDSVIYCVCHDSAAAREVSLTMRANGFRRIRAIRGGIDAWQRRGFPVEAAVPEERNAAAKRGKPHNQDAVTLRSLAPRSAARKKPKGG